MEPAPANPEPAHRPGPLVAAAALGLVVTALVLWPMFDPSPPRAADLLQAGDIHALVGHVLHITAIMTVRFALIGLCMGVIVGLLIRHAGRAALIGAASGLAIGLIAAVLHRVDGVAWPGGDALALAAGFGLVGHAFGWGMTLRGRRRWLAVGALGLVSLVVVAWGWSIAGRVIEPAPAAIDMNPITAADKRRLIEVAKRTLDSPQQGIATVRYSRRDLERLGAWACDIAPGNQAVMLDLDHGRAIVTGRIDLPGDDRFMNISSMQRIGITRGRLDVGWQWLKLGQWDVPRSLLYIVTPVVRSLIVDDPGGRAVVSQVAELTLGTDRLTIRYDVDGMSQALRDQLGRGSQLDIQADIADYVNHALTDVASLPRRRDNRLEAIIARLFAMAQQRSSPPAGDPVRENRAALYALSTLLGDGDIQRFTGQTLDTQRWPKGAGPLHAPMLRKRFDWTRHLAVSAGVTLLTNDGVSNAVGLLKEEIDSAAGGSGFSFGDWAADRAGTRLALAATRNAESARRIQQLLSQPNFDTSLIFPEAADLPEGLTDAQMQQQYDGIGGRRFKQLTAEIERRLDTCAALR